MGFVALLGIISLAGMIMRNSVILVDQIQQDLRRGLSQWDAIIESTVRRMRPITLTAAAAALAMIPLSRSIFWGPMAVAVMGGWSRRPSSPCFFCRAVCGMVQGSARVKGDKHAKEMTTLMFVGIVALGGVAASPRLIQARRIMPIRRLEGATQSELPIDPGAATVRLQYGRIVPRNGVQEYDPFCIME